MTEKHAPGFAFPERVCYTEPMKQKRLKNDILLILALLLLAGAAWAVLRFTRRAGGAAVVTVDGVAVDTLPLGENGRFPIDTGAGQNLVEVSDGRVRVAEADCPDGLCVRSGWARYAGESIVCLPHKLVVTVEGGRPGPDAVTGG